MLREDEPIWGVQMFVPFEKGGKGEWVANPTLTCQEAEAESLARARAAPFHKGIYHQVVPKRQTF